MATATMPRTLSQSSGDAIVVTPRSSMLRRLPTHTSTHTHTHSTHTMRAQADTTSKTKAAIESAGACTCSHEIRSDQSIAALRTRAHEQPRNYSTTQHPSPPAKTAERPRSRLPRRLCGPSPTPRQANASTRRPRRPYQDAKAKNIVISRARHPGVHLKALATI